ncbi:hypothetical protein [Rhizobium laguerreae]|uniref:hypothetical protein n=1 Tax=Rhizobium laguerreae TaxID=1076926 RepID=UPI001C909337|nr:hypothetical protein [Rhizobium laguerreae]MBY3363777.1 hypothetical protein [Rhizobium laguerreae]
MATFTSARTSATDVAIRLQEVEAVLRGVLDKLGDITAPENPDLTDVKDKLARLYRIVTFGAKEDNSLSDPYAETVFDTAENSLFYATFGFESERVADILAGTGTSTLASLICRADNDYFWTSGSNVVTLTFGDGGGGFAEWYKTNSVALSGSVFGTTDMLDAIIGDGVVTETDSIAYLTFGSPALLESWRAANMSLARSIYGNAGPPSIAAVSLVDAIFAGSPPTAFDQPLLTRIEQLESRMSSAESRLSSAGL